jgi:hypothetical protein
LSDTHHPYVTAFYRRSAGHALRDVDSRHADFVSAFKANPALAAAAREEMNALAARGQARGDFQGDHEGKIRYRALSRMMAQFDAENT